MPMNRFWSAIWTVAGFLFLIGLFQMIADTILTGFGLLPGIWQVLLILISQAVVPIFSSLTFIDWRWGWKADNAGLRRTGAALFWSLPGLLVGLLAAGVALLISGGLTGGISLALSGNGLLMAALGVVGAFTTELIFRGIVVSRFQGDLSGRDLLIAAVATPIAWTVIQRIFGFGLGTGIAGLGTAVLSACLTLLFLRTDSVWLSAGIRAGLVLLPLLLNRALTENALLLVFAVPTAILLWLEIDKQRTIRRPGPRKGPQRVVFGKTVRGPWGPH